MWASRGREFLEMVVEIERVISGEITPSTPQVMRKLWEAALGGSLWR